MDRVVVVMVVGRVVVVGVGWQSVAAGEVRLKIGRGSCRERGEA